MKLVVTNTLFWHLTKSIFLVFTPLLLIYKLLSPDPNGIAFGLLLSLFALCISLVNWSLVFYKRQASYQLYVLAVTASTVNVYLSVRFLRYISDSAFTDIVTLINLFILSGVLAGITLLVRIVKFINNQQSRYIKE
mgnify:CR=1 FL=1